MRRRSHHTNAASTSLPRDVFTQRSQLRPGIDDRRKHSGWQPEFRQHVKGPVSRDRIEALRRRCVRKLDDLAAAEQPVDGVGNHQKCRGLFH